jgi:hypothetical protein
VEAAVLARASVDMPGRDVVADLHAAEDFLRRGVTGIDIIRVLARRGFKDIAEKILAVQKLRISGDFLQTSAIVLPGARVLSAVNDANDYQGPGSGYRLSGDRAAEVADIPQALDPLTVGQVDAARRRLNLQETGPAAAGVDPAEIVIALGPAFGSALDATLLGLPHADVLAALMEGIRAEGMLPRVVKVYATSDCGFVGHTGARLSGSGVAIGIQSKGTTVIHQRDLDPLNNLELFPQAPNLTLESYRVIGGNAAKYARRVPVLPVPVQIDNMARLKHIVKTTILHLRETAEVVAGKPPQDVQAHFPESEKGAARA